MSDYRFTFRDLPWDTVSQGAWQWGTLEAGDAFVPVEWEGTSFELICGDELEAAGTPRLVLSDAVVPDASGFIRATIDPAVFGAAGFAPNQLIYGAIVSIVEGVRAEFADGTIMFKGKAVSA